MNDIVQFVLKHGYLILFAPLFAHKPHPFPGSWCSWRRPLFNRMFHGRLQTASSGLTSAAGRHTTRTLRR